MIQKLSVIGLGKLGLPMAVFFASKGFQVIGIDVNLKLIKMVNEKKCPIYEPGLPELLKNSGKALVATDDYKYAIENSEASLIFLPTPSEGNKAFSTEYVELAGNRIAQNLKNKDVFHLIVLRSTVLPGATARLKDNLERVSGKKCGIDFGLCYNPEFLALGNVLRNLANPDLILIGESDPKSGELLSSIYRRICENNPSIIRTNFGNAELGKILLNNYITVKISFANMMAELCERVSGGDIDVVSQILGLDPRIGRKYLSGGLAFGGTCFPRDNEALTYFARTVGIEAKVAKVIDEVNHYQNERIVKLVREKMGELRGRKIAILGITFKPDTNIVDESASLEIAKSLFEGGALVSVYDPAGMGNAAKVFGENLHYATSVEECLKDAEFCILATPWEEFKSLKPEHFLKYMRQPALLDCWRIFNGPEFREKLKYYAIGLYCV
jgi:UDPglucose 6-dehydrogenase